MVLFSSSTTTTTTAKTTALGLLLLLLLPSRTVVRSQPYAITDCVPRFLALGFNGFDFDRYDDFYDDDSTFTLAQTGVYTGADAIEEYVRFLDVSTPYWEARQDFNRTVQLLPQRFDAATGTCGIGFATDQSLAFNSSLTDGRVLNFAAYRNVVFSIPEDKIKAITLYYTPEVLTKFLEGLATPGVNNFICGVLNGDQCIDALATAPSTSKSSKSSKKNRKKSKSSKSKSSKASKQLRKCEEHLAGLPVYEGDTAYADGNTQSCRAVHAVFARINPFHCAHIALEPTPDPAGVTKCAVSEGVDPNDLFLPEEIEIYRNFCRDSVHVDDNCLRVVSEGIDV